MSYPRSPARWLGPLALAAALAAVLAIVTTSTGTEEADSPRPSSPSQEQGGGGSERRDRPAEETGQTSTDGDDGATETAPRRKTYTVKAGDTLAGIAEETGVPIEEIERLNPGVDASSLSIGQEIRLAR